MICTNTTYPYIDTVNGLGLATQIFGEKSFHSLDYAFYYENVKENVGLRTERYLNKGSGISGRNAQDETVTELFADIIINLLRLAALY
ncbi:MAG TPA: hypothetical protein DCL38_00410 [Lachnospiraceae bacterium]|nr:hypothetical protein [Lachnospiraceae bacterium]